MKRTKFLLPFTLMLTLIVGCGQTTSSNTNTEVLSSGSKESSTSSEELPKELKIITQPVSTTISYPNGYSFETKVNNENLVKSYQWQVGSYDVDNNPTWFQDIGGNGAKLNKLVYHGSTNEGSKRPYRCMITDIYDNVTYTNIVEVIIENYGDFVPAAYLCDYSIKPGQTIDLSKINYGSGSITFDNNGHDFLFDNVNFSNENCDLWDLSIGFTIQNYKTPYSEYNFTFKGINVMNNTYWQEDMNQGGTNFVLYFMDLEENETVVNFKAYDSESTLTMMGGTYQVKGNSKFVLDIDTSMYGLPHRLTKGIVTEGFVLKENRQLNAYLGGHIIFTEYTPNHRNSDVILEKESCVNGIINAAHVVNGATYIAAISSATSIYAYEGSIIDIEAIIDANFLTKTFHAISPLEGLTTSYGPIYMEGSELDFKAEVINSNGIYDFVGANIVGMGAPSIEIINSKINFDANSGLFNGVKGIYTDNLIIENSNIKIDVGAYQSADGIIVSYGVDDEIGDLTITNSSLDVNVYIEEKPNSSCVAAALRAKTMDITLNDENILNLKSNNGPAIALTFDISETKVTPIDSYSFNRLNLDAFNIEANNAYIHNISSFYNGYYYIVYETLMTINLDFIKQIKIINN